MNSSINGKDQNFIKNKSIQNLEKLSLKNSHNLDKGNKKEINNLISSSLNKMIKCLNCKVITKIKIFSILKYILMV